MQPAIRQIIERRIVERVIHDLLKVGFELSLHNGDDGEEYVVKQTREFSTIAEKIMQTDEDKLIVHSVDGHGKRERMVEFIYGNDGFDVIHDHSSSLDPVIEPIIFNAEYIGMGQSLPSDTQLKPFLEQPVADDPASPHR